MDINSLEISFLGLDESVSELDPVSIFSRVPVHHGVLASCQLAHLSSLLISQGTGRLGLAVTLIPYHQGKIKIICCHELTDHGEVS